MNDQDLELLENYLDDELTGRELEALRQRLSSEPQLVAAVDELRSQREMRQQFFAACEPDEASVRRLMNSVQREATREVATGGGGWSLRWASGLAACLVFGFVMGRGMHGTPISPTDNSNSPNSQIVDARPTSAQRMDFHGPMVPINPNVGSVDFRLNPGAVTVGAPDPFPGDRIFIVDGAGRLVQRFDSHEQYMKFVEQKLGSSTQPAEIAP
jgi:hypothetical protein